MPASRTQRTTAGAGRSMTTPRASSTSADPDDDEAARLPCLATGTPAGGGPGGGGPVPDGAEGREHVRRPRRRRGGAVAVLGDRDTRGRGHEGGHRRDVDGVRAVAAAADDVD